MFAKNEENRLILTIENVIYDFLSVEDYKKLVLYLTNPKKTLNFDLQMSPDLQAEDLVVCEKYKNFINKFISLRNDIELEVRLPESCDGQDGLSAENIQVDQEELTESE